MIDRRTRRLVLAGVLSMLLFAARTAAGQGGLGSGPLTSTLPVREPEMNVINLGTVRLAPGLTIREMGHDDNVFNESVNPKEDWVIAGTPDITAFTRMRFVQLAAYAGSDMQYYQTYESERNIGYSLRARVDLIGSRLSPFFGGGRLNNRVRPNGEIDTRADLQTDELSGGLAYELSTHAHIFAAAIQTTIDYRDAFQSGVSLDQSLSRQGTEYQGGVKTALTPLTSLELRGSFKKDEFKYTPERDGESSNFSAIFSFDTAAVISGAASFGYQDYEPDDPLVTSYRGFVGNANITYPLLEIGRFNFGYNRGTEYSFDVAESYYLENSFNAAYTQRLIGQVDLQGRAAHSDFDYGNRAGGTDRTDSLESYNGNLGYNLRNRTRVALNYEYARRRSPEIAERNYIRRRVYLSWMVAF